jgi:hypothetical protein
MATASHAAGLELRQTVWVMQAVGEDGQWENTALEGFERYGLVSSIIKIGPVLLQLAVTSKVLNNAGSQRTCALV